MPPKPYPSLLPALAVLLTLAGLLTMLFAGVKTPEALARLGKKQAQLDALRSMAAEDRAATQRLDPPAWAGEPTDLAALLEEVLPGAKADLKRQEAVVTGADWNVSPVEVTLEDADLPTLGAFLTRAERAVPPWRLAEALIAPSDRQPGRGRAVLVFETPERPAP